MAEFGWQTATGRAAINANTVYVCKGQELEKRVEDVEITRLCRGVCFQGSWRGRRTFSEDGRDCKNTAYQSSFCFKESPVDGIVGRRITVGLPFDRFRSGIPPAATSAAASPGPRVKAGEQQVFRASLPPAEITPEPVGHPRWFL